ncbi:MAG: hypothetical protein U1F65_06960 [Verrucomicrobiota bacterium]
MSEFKFACPICGQHITADSSGSGSQLECPTCFRKIVVPQAPASADAKFILSAAEANKPKAPAPSVPKLEPVTPSSEKSSLPLIVAGVAFLLVLGGAAVLWAKGFGHKTTTAGEVAQNGATNDDDVVPEKKAATASAAPITNDIAWNNELAALDYPSTPVAGRLRGEFVSCNRNVLNGGVLNFRQVIKGLPDLSVTIHFFAKQPEELRGKTFGIATNDFPVPRVAIRWKEGKENKAQMFTNNYALKLELADIANGKISGKVYLSLPDDSQSRVAGTFVADVKRPAPPKPKAPKPKPGS